MKKRFEIIKKLIMFLAFEVVVMFCVTGLMCLYTNLEFSPTTMVATYSCCLAYYVLSSITGAINAKKK